METVARQFQAKRVVHVYSLKAPIVGRGTLPPRSNEYKVMKVMEHMNSRQARMTYACLTVLYGIRMVSKHKIYLLS